MSHVIGEELYSQHGKVRISLLGRPKVSVPVVPEKIILKPETKPAINGDISGERLFLCYTFPCVEECQDGHPRGLRSRFRQKDILELTSVIDKGGDPTHMLMSHCFPGPVYMFGEYTGINTLLDVPWPVEKVRSFWSLHKGQGKMCAVFYGTVIDIQRLHVIVELDDGVTVPAMNRYKLPISKGDTAVLHKCIVVEVKSGF